MSTPLVITQIQSLLESKKWDLVVTSCEDIEIEVFIGLHFFFLFRIDINTFIKFNI